MKHESMLHAARALLVAGTFLVAACAPPAVSAQATDETSWAHARQLADEGRYAESLAAIRVALAAHPDDTGLLWLQAGVTSQAGDHAKAVRLYDALVAAHPEMADDTALDRGEALTFAGRFDEAEAVYDAVLSRDPGNTQARAGQARILNWGGRHREAALLYRYVLRDDPTESDAAKGLAHAEYWAGRNDLARRALVNVPADSDREIDDLRRRLDEERRPSLTVRYESSHDSDDLDVRTGQFTYREPVGERDAFDFTLRGDRVEDEAGGYDLVRMVWGHERVWSHAWQTHAYAGVVVEEGPAHPFLFDTWVTYRPLDALRFDLGVAREQVLTRDALALGITYFSPSLSAEWWMTRRWLARLAHRQNFYSDDNRT
ncbi:MAG: tetratricopeptide repeat protein, partial [Candidatus Eisenbacteria bacterium]